MADRRRRHLIQLIYDAGGSLLDCEYITDAEEVDRFHTTMADEYKRLSSISVNNTVRPLSDKTDLPDELAELTDYHTLKRQCRKLHQRIRSNR